MGRVRGWACDLLGMGLCSIVVLVECARCCPWPWLDACLLEHSLQPDTGPVLGSKPQAWGLGSGLGAHLLVCHAAAQVMGPRQAMGCEDPCRLSAELTGNQMGLPALPTSLRPGVLCHLPSGPHEHSCTLHTLSQRLGGLTWT